MLNVVETVFGNVDCGWAWDGTKDYICWCESFLGLAWNTGLCWVVWIVNETLMVRLVDIFEQK